MIRDPLGSKLGPSSTPGVYVRGLNPYHENSLLVGSPRKNSSGRLKLILMLAANFRSEQEKSGLPSVIKKKKIKRLKLDVFMNYMYMYMHVILYLRKRQFHMLNA